MSSPNDAAQRALLSAIESWADSRDAFTLAQMDERVRPSEQTRERTAKAGGDVKRSRALMLEAIERFGADCAREGARETYEAIRVSEERAELDPQLPCWGCRHALCVHTAGELGDECTECQCVGFETKPAEAELEPACAAPTVKP